MAQKTAKKQQNKEINKKPQAKATKKIFDEMEIALEEKLSVEEFLEYKRLSAKMSTKKKLFCLYYARDNNGAEAARNAGYSAKSARSAAWRLLTEDDVREFQAFLRRCYEAPQIAEIAEIMKKYTRILRREEMEYIPVVIKSRKSYYDKNGKKKLVDKEEVKIVEIPTKISDVNHAADSMMKRWGAFKENVTVSGTVKNRIEVEDNDISMLAKTMTIAEMENVLRSAKLGEGAEDEQS